MLKDAKAFSGFSVDDLQRAKSFYGETLGLEVVDVSLGVDGADIPSGLELRIAGGSTIAIYPKEGHTPATFTVLNFPVDDIEAAVDELTQRGVSFEIYGGAIKTDARGIHRNPDVRPVAWFKDPAGNILSLVERDK
jgi:catechol 2,3-dioxygenase-like lactoylglutathione lyase family enzyme